MLIVFNPAAGRRRTQRLWRVLDVMAESGVKVEIAETRWPGHAAELARDGALRGKRLVVAAGGDGTIAEVANGLAGSGVTMGVIPLGTANVLAHELGLPFDPRAVAAALAFQRTRLVWPGLLAGPAAATERRLFVQMAGVGFDAQVVHRLNPWMKRAIGRGAYVLQGVRELARYGFSPIRLSIDGRDTEAGSVIVTKGHFYAGRFQLAPGASPTERGLTVALFDGAGPCAAMKYGVALPMNLMPHMRSLRVLPAHEVAIASDSIPAQADGDPAGEAPLVLTEASEPMEIVVA